MVQRQVERLPLPALQRLPRPPPDFRLQAPAPQRPHHPVFRQKQRLGPFFLRAGPFDMRNDAQREARVFPRLSDDMFKKVNHKPAALAATAHHARFPLQCNPSPRPATPRCPGYQPPR